MPHLLVVVSWGSLLVAAMCSIAIITDLMTGHRQKMWIMNLVWPVTALYGGPVALWFYFKYGRLSAKEKPFPVVTAVAATHCGAGCTIGDFFAEWGVFLIPALGGFLFQTKMFNTWVIDFAAAYVLGIAFQYFTIVPMRKLAPLPGLWVAMKADTLSLAAWQVGMYGWMAVAVFVIFGREIEKTSPVFWFMMQIAMLCGFATSYPVNWWLVQNGMKERM